jgi:hypothetical protein
MRKRDTAVGRAALDMPKKEEGYRRQAAIPFYLYKLQSVYLTIYITSLTSLTVRGTSGRKSAARFGA